MSDKVTIDICRNPAKGYSIYINGIRVYGMEPLFEPPKFSFSVEKDRIAGALEGKSLYDIKRHK